MNKLFVLLVAALSIATTKGNAVTRSVSFLKGLSLNLIKINRVESNGGYRGKCLAVAITNLSNEPLEVKMDPALIFKPNDERFQNLVSVGEEILALKPKQTKFQSLQTFCGKAPARSPKSCLVYSFWKQGSQEMILASKYIKQHELFNSMGQHAIWMFTNNHSLSSVCSYGKVSEQQEKFVAYLAKITNQSIPEYHTYKQINENSNGGSVYNPATSVVSVTLKWDGEKPRNTHAYILDEKRKIVDTVKNGEVINSKGEHRLKVDFKVSKWKEGIYYVQMIDDESHIYIEKKAVVAKSS